jgi:hypothetical protein
MGEKMMERVAEMMAYFNYDGVPVYIRKYHFPVRVSKGKEKPITSNFEKFFRESTLITKTEFDRLVAKGT